MVCCKTGKLGILIRQSDSIRHATAHLCCQSQIRQGIITLLVENTLDIIILLSDILHHSLDRGIGCQLTVALIFGTHTLLMLVYQCFNGWQVIWQDTRLSCKWAYDAH